MEDDEFDYATQPYFKNRSEKELLCAILKAIHELPLEHIREDLAEIKQLLKEQIEQNKE
jgi:hypothetical protein